VTVIAILAALLAEDHRQRALMRKMLQEDSVRLTP